MDQPQMHTASATHPLSPVPCHIPFPAPTIMSPEDDPFLDSSMQVDDPVQITLKKHTPPSTPSRVHIQDTTLQKISKQLGAAIQPESNDKDVQSDLDMVFFIIHKALSEDQTLSTHLADEGEFRENLKKAGEDKFINLLEEIVARVA
jgi:hypothetical protein